MDCYKNYLFWLENEYFDDNTKEELLKIKDNPKEIEDRFYKELEFGTGGLRGIIGAGTNRMNKYTVRKTSQGVANYIARQGEESKNRGIVIAYDPRYKSQEFALDAAKTFAGNGIKAYLFDELRPTPELSFAVRYLKAAAGIMITASHNPKEYNGYKVYSKDGAQLTMENSDAVLEEISKINDVAMIKQMDEKMAIEKGLMEIIGKKIDDEYISSLKSLCINPELIEKAADSLKIIYTPLHGSGNIPVRRILQETGFKHVMVVKEQEKPDSEFSTVKSPNPEERASFTLAIELARKEDADLIIGTDPDGDRVGVVIRSAESEYTFLTGNQIGCLLMEYILSQKKAKGELPVNGFVIKTIVTTELATAIANYYNVELVEVLTGFKFIGEQIKFLDEFGDKKYLFGFEESYGYLAGTFVRDKDAVVTSMLVAEMAAYFKSRGMSIYEGLQELYGKYGWYLDGIASFALAGREGLERITLVMNKLRSDRPVRFNGSEVAAIRDYLVGARYDLASGEMGKLTLPESDVLYFEMKDGSWFCVRPSGTEPKIKIYFGVSCSSATAAEDKIKILQENVLGKVKSLIY